MKQCLLTMAAGIAMLFGGQAYAQSECCKSAAPVLYEGVGPVISGSTTVAQLPKEARDFLKKHFKDSTVVQCEKEFDDNTYEVELADGTDVEFDARGNWIEVDAGRRRILPLHLVKALVPHKAYKELESRNVVAQVESVKRVSRGYKVEIKNAEYDDYRFEHDGKLISVSR